MRGGLDDALARMARMEQLRRRAAEPAVSPATVVEELIEAARRVVSRDGELSVTVTVGYRGRTSSVRVEHHEGDIRVSVAPVQPEPPGDGTASPPAPLEPRSAASQLAELLRQSERR